MNSIKAKFFLWFFSLTSTLLIVLGFSFYHELNKAILSSVDTTLHSKMQILKGLLHEENGEIELEMMEIVSGEYAIPRSGHYYKVMINGKILAASPSLVDNDFNFTSGQLEIHNEQRREWIYTSIGPDKEPIRVLQHDFEFLDRPVAVFAAESLIESLILINRMKFFLLITIPTSLFIIGLIGLWIVRQSLKPLKSFSTKIRKITHKTLNEKIDTKSQVQEIRSLALSFNEMLNRLQKAFETEKRIISDASHELKTPVSVIKAQCDVILQKERRKEEYIEALYTIKIVSENMGKLINDLLFLARIDSGLFLSSEFKSFSLSDCLKETIQLVDILAQKNHVHINTVFNDNISIVGDKKKLTEVFLNIVENAIRYNKSGGSVHIILSKNTEYVKVQVKDTGIGIKEKDLERIFERFYRADVSRSTKNTGLGLSIAKAIIEAHNGKIIAKSDINKGSCFFITLPFSQSTIPK